MIPLHLVQVSCGAGWNDVWKILRRLILHCFEMLFQNKKIACVFWRFWPTRPWVRWRDCIFRLLLWMLVWWIRRCRFLLLSMKCSNRGPAKLSRILLIYWIYQVTSPPLAWSICCGIRSWHCCPVFCWVYRKKDDFNGVVWLGSPSTRTCWKWRAVCGMSTHLQLLVNGTVLVVMRIVTMWWRWVVVETIVWPALVFFCVLPVRGGLVFALLAGGPWHPVGHESVGGGWWGRGAPASR